MFGVPGRLASRFLSWHSERRCSVPVIKFCPRGIGGHPDVGLGNGVAFISRCCSILSYHVIRTECFRLSREFYQVFLRSIDRFVRL